MLRRDAANNNSATTNIPQRLRDNVQAGCRQQLSSKAGRRQLIRADKAGCRQQLYFKAGGRQRSWCEYVPIFSKQQWNCHTVASLENSRLYIYILTRWNVYKPPTWRNSEASIHNRRGAADTFNTTHCKTEYYIQSLVFQLFVFVSPFFFGSIMSGVGFRCFFKKNFWFFIFFETKITCVSWVYLAYLKMQQDLKRCCKI